MNFPFTDHSCSHMLASPSTAQRSRSVVWPLSGLISWQFALHPPLWKLWPDSLDITHTFPMGLNVSTDFPGNLCLTPIQNDPIHALPMHTRPYQNIRIIGVIWDLYFMGGNNSFAHWYRACFPTFENEQGVVQEVPPVMVAVVATAVSASFYMITPC